MGLFSPKKVVKVASSVYNLAGDVEKRPNFLKTNLYGSVIAGDGYLGEVIARNYLQGPGIQQRQLFRAAQRTNYAGLPTASIHRQLSVDPTVVEPFIPVPAGHTLSLQTSYVEDGDVTLFAEKWLMENYPERLGEDWTAEFDPSNDTILIEYATHPSDTFVTTYDPDGRYVVADYLVSEDSIVYPVIEGTLVEDVYTAALPNRTGNVSVSSTLDRTDNFNLAITTQTDVAYSDGSTGSSTTVNGVENASHDVYHEVEEWLETLNGGTSSYTNRRNILNLWAVKYVVADRNDVTITTEDIGGGVIRTTTVTVTGERLEDRWDYREDTQDTDVGMIQGGEQKFVYKIGDGNAVLDALDEDVDNSAFAEFFPVIPIRLKNTSIHAQKFQDSGLYDQARKMYRKATNNKSFMEIIEEINDHDKVDDMDYVYQTYGVPLNVVENSSRIYLYEFWKSLMQFQNTTPLEMQNFHDKVQEYRDALAALKVWEAANMGDNDREGTRHPLRGTPAPKIPTIVQPETSTLRIKTQSPIFSSFDTRISWINISEEVGVSGSYLLRPAQGQTPEIRAKKGEVHVVKGGTYSWDVERGFETPLQALMKLRQDPKAYQIFYIVHQVEDNHYNILTVNGAVYNNYIYKGKSVRITAHEAIDDEDESGFLCPLHFPTIRSMSLKHSTQMATANTYLIINSYQVKKIKWYQRGFFKIILVIAIVAISVLINPGAFSSAGGLLGANVAVGASLGLTGTAAIVAGAVANALAAIVVTQVIGGVSSQLFGEKWGALISSIVTFAITMGFSGGFGAGFNWSSLTSAQGILQFTNALANGYSGWTQANIAEINDEMIHNQERYERESERLQKMLSELQGGSDLGFNPLELTDVDQPISGSYLPESMDEFIHRTTMTGSEVVDITFRMINDYTELALTLPQN